MFEFLDNIVVGIGIGAGWLLFALLVLFLLVNKTPILAARKIVTVIGDCIDDVLYVLERIDVKALKELLDDVAFQKRLERNGQPMTPEVKANQLNAFHDAIEKKRK